jgi:hypothetical protein
MEQGIVLLKQFNQFGLFGAVARAMMMKWREFETATLGVFDEIRTDREGATVLDKAIAALHEAGAGIPRDDGSPPTQ